MKRYGGATIKGTDQEFAINGAVQKANISESKEPQLKNSGSTQSREKACCESDFIANLYAHTNLENLPEKDRSTEFRSSQNNSINHMMKTPSKSRVQSENKTKKSFINVGNFESSFQMSHTCFNGEFFQKPNEQLAKESVTKKHIEFKMTKDSNKAFRRNAGEEAFSIQTNENNFSSSNTNPAEHTIGGRAKNNSFCRREDLLSMKLAQNANILPFHNLSGRVHKRNNYFTERNNNAKAGLTHEGYQAILPQLKQENYQTLDELDVIFVLTRDNSNVFFSSQNMRPPGRKNGITLNVGESMKLMLPGVILPNISTRAQKTAKLAPTG